MSGIELGIGKRLGLHIGLGLGLGLRSWLIFLFISQTAYLTYWCRWMTLSTNHTWEKNPQSLLPGCTPPKNVVFGYDVRKISASCLVLTIEILFTCHIFDEVDNLVISGNHVLEDDGKLLFWKCNCYVVVSGSISESCPAAANGWEHGNSTTKAENRIFQLHCFVNCNCITAWHCCYCYIIIKTDQWSGYMSRSSIAANPNPIIIIIIIILCTYIAHQTKNCL